MNAAISRPLFDFTAPGWEIVEAPDGRAGYVNHARKLAPATWGTREALLRNASGMVETPYTIAKARASYAETHGTPEEAAQLRAEVGRMDQEEKAQAVLGFHRVSLSDLAKIVRETAPAPVVLSDGAPHVDAWGRGCAAACERVANALADRFNLRPTERAAFCEACGVTDLKG